MFEGRALGPFLEHACQASKSFQPPRGINLDRTQYLSVVWLLSDPVDDRERKLPLRKVLGKPFVFCILNNKNQISKHSLTRLRTTLL
jgi:hypothetical protein